MTRNEVTAPPGRINYSPSAEPQGAVALRPEQGAASIGSIAIVLVQLALAAVVIREFQLESRTFFNVFVLASVAFGVHALLPLQYRMPFFAAVSLGAI